MLRKVAFLILQILLITLFSACNASNNSESASSASSRVKVGLVVSLSGPAAEMGKSWLDGALLAESELRQDGFDLELIVDDDQTLAARAVSAFQKQVRVNRVQAVIGGTWDFLAESLYPLAAQSRTPFLTPSNPVELINPEIQQKNKWIFTNGLSVSAEGKAIEQLMQAGRQIHSAALLYPELPWGYSHAEMFRGLCKKYNIDLPLQFAFPYESQLDSLRSAALQVSRHRTELLYAPLDASGIDVLTSELRRLKLNPLIVVSQHLHSAAGIVTDIQQISRVIGVYPKVFDRDFEQRFKAFHGHAPRVFAEFGYDALKFMVLAIKAGAVFDRDDAFQYQGLTGIHQFDPMSPSLSKGSAELLIWSSGSLKPYNLIQ